MFMLLNNGKHPFYVKGESRKEFNKKIENCKINFYNKVSPMAKHLIFKLLEPNPSWRYNAAQAYKHPWITRNKYDEVSQTFNELLHKSNMKKVGRNLFGVVLFLNFLTNKKKYSINDKYVNVCNFYDEKSKKKMERKKETCLDVLSTSEGDESDSEIEKEKDLLLKKTEKNNELIINTPQKLYIASSTQLKTNNIMKKKKLNFAKSSKNVGDFKKMLNNTEKKQSLNIKKIEYKFNLLTNKKPKIESIPKNKPNNVLKVHPLKISINPQNNNKTKEIIKRNSNKLFFGKEYKASNQSMSLRALGNSKSNKINNIYFEYFSKKQLPEINTTIKKRESDIKRSSFNNSQNCIVVPLVLPSIKSAKKVNNLQNYIKDFMLNNNFRKRKKW